MHNTWASWHIVIELKIIVFSNCVYFAAIGNSIRKGCINRILNSTSFFFGGTSIAKVKGGSDLAMDFGTFIAGAITNTLSAVAGIFEINTALTRFKDLT